MTIHSDSPAADLSGLRIDRDAAPRRRWVPWVVVARHSSDVGVKSGGRLARLRFEEGTRVRKGDVIAEIEHADIEAQLEAARRMVAEAEAQLAQTIAARDEDARALERQRALAKDGITTHAALTAAEAAAAVSAARVKSADAAIASARARVLVTEEALENTNVRAPFDGVVIKKRAEVGETVSPFGVAGQATREGGAVATLRALGFSRTRIVTAFLVESIALAIVGGVLGCAIALPVHGLSTGTTNFTSFTEVAFKFEITAFLLFLGLVFSAVMGAVGGLLPAIRAARIPVARALREI